MTLHAEPVRPAATAMDADRFSAALDFPAYLETVVKNRDLWHAVYERVRLPAELVERAAALEEGPHLLALSEDWCGDAVNTLPVVARLAEAAEWDFRVLGRDSNPDLMDAHLTNGRSRSIPVVVAYDADFHEVGWWGPRPGELQRWVLSDGLSMSSPERYKVVRGWYARDRGRAVVEEILALVDRAG